MVVINYMILLFTVTINEIKVCDNWLNIEGSIQLKLTWSIKFVHGRNKPMKIQ